MSYVDVSAIDILLISSLDDILVLPFLCQHPEFRALIYATQPVKELGKALAQEFQKLVSTRDRQIPAVNAETATN